MTTQDILRPTGGAHLHPDHPRRTEVERAAVIGAFTADLIGRRDAEQAAKARNIIQPPTPAVDPDATVVIGRHRQDGTRTPARRRFVGRVAAAAVGLFRRAAR